MYGTGFRETKCFAAYLDYGPRAEQPILVEDPVTAKETVSSFAHGLWRESDKQVYMREEAGISQVIRVYSSGRSALDDQPGLERIADACRKLDYEPVIHVYSMTAGPSQFHEPSRFFAPYREDREVYWLLGRPYRCTRLDYRWRDPGMYTRKVTRNGILEEVAFAALRITSKSFSFRVWREWNDEKSARWPSQVRLISRNQTSLEVEIQDRGSCFYVIVGNGTYENYLCIPTLDIGCAIARPDDLFWNSERLSRHLNTVDSITIATGLKYLDQL